MYNFKRSSTLSSLNVQEQESTHLSQEGKCRQHVLATLYQDNIIASEISVLVTKFKILFFLALEIPPSCLCTGLIPSPELRYYSWLCLRTICDAGDWTSAGQLKDNHRNHCATHMAPDLEMLNFPPCFMHTRISSWQWSLKSMQKGILDPRICLAARKLPKTHDIILQWS